MNPRSIGSLLLLGLFGCDSGSTEPPAPIPGVPARWGNQARVPTSSHLRGIRWGSANRAIVVGDSTSIFRTNDGGATWQQQEHQPFGQGGDIAGFDFLEGDLIAVGSNPAGTAARGWGSAEGVNWTTVQTTPPGAPFLAADLATATTFNQPNLGFFLRSDGKVRRRTDPDNPTVEPDSGHGAPRKIDGISLGTVVVVGDGGLIRASASYGEAGTWTTLAHAAPPMTQNLHGVQVLSLSRIFACGANGTILFTNTGDDLAVLPGSPTAQTLRSIYFPASPANGWAVGDGGAIVKINGTYNGMADTWSFTLGAQTSNTGHHLYDVHFVDENIGMAVGENGTIRKTIDGGANWFDPVAGGQGTLETLNAIDFEPAGDRGLAVGNNSTVLRTLNGGVTWTSFATGVPGGQTIRSVSLSRIGGTEKAILCGDGGLVLRNTDPWGTGAWQAPGTAPPAENYYAVVCFSDNSAIMVGDNGTIVQTNDLLDNLAADWSWSGDVWAGATPHFRSLCITSDLYAFAAGTGGVLANSDLLAIFPSNTWAEIVEAPALGGGVTVLSIDSPAGGNIVYLACDDDVSRRVLTPRSSPTLQTGGALPGVSATNGVAVFAPGFLFLAGNKMWLSADGGTSWTESFTHTKQTMNAVWRRSLTGEIGFACGTMGTILRTDVGGD